MKSTLKTLIAVAVLFHLASCSCAIEHTWIQAKSGGRITSSSFRDASMDSGFKSTKGDGTQFHKRGVYMSWSTEERILVYSAFCPTPISILMRGADARAWQVRCDEVKAALFAWYAQRGITLETVRDSSSNEEAQHVGTSKGGSRL